MTVHAFKKYYYDNSLNCFYANPRLFRPYLGIVSQLACFWSCFDICVLIIRSLCVAMPAASRVRLHSTLNFEYTLTNPPENT